MQTQIQTQLQPQNVRTVAQTSGSQARLYQDDSRVLSQKIENISNLMSSLNAAVHDLEGAESPAINAEFDFYIEVRRFETRLINTALRLSGGSQVKAAALLKLKATTLNAKMKSLNLPRMR